MVGRGGARCAAAVVTAAAGHVGSGASQALGEAEAAGLIHITAKEVEFSHPLLRSAAYHGAAPALRRAAHRALAQSTGRP